MFCQKRGRFFKPYNDLNGDSANGVLKYTTAERGTFSATKGERVPLQTADSSLVYRLFVHRCSAGVKCRSCLLPNSF